MVDLEFKVSEIATGEGLPITRVNDIQGFGDLAVCPVVQALKPAVLVFLQDVR